MLAKKNDPKYKLAIDAAVSETGKSAEELTNQEMLDVLEKVLNSTIPSQKEIVEIFKKEFKNLTRPR